MSGNDDLSHPLNGWNNIEVGDLVYHTPVATRHRIDVSEKTYEMGVVLHRLDGAAVLYSYTSNQQVLVRVNYLQKVEI